MTQKQQIYEYMKKNGSITTMQAFHIGITRLSARIWDLKADGVKIKSETVKYKAQDGKRKTYDMYMLEGE